MKEGSPEMPQNRSMHTLRENLAPEYRGRYGYNRYITDETGEIYYYISNNSEKQFMISQLASLVIPVAHILKKDFEHGPSYFFSSDATRHPDYKENNHLISTVDQTLLELLFRDTDHDIYNNYEGTIFYDFGLGDAHVKHTIEEVTERTEDICDDFLRYDNEHAPELVSKLHTFKTHIEGASGLQFIAALIVKSGFTKATAEVIQNNLLQRCNTALDVFEKHLNDNTSNA